MRGIRVTKLKTTKIKFRDPFEEVTKIASPENYRLYSILFLKLHIVRHFTSDMRAYAVAGHVLAYDTANWYAQKRAIKVREPQEAENERLKSNKKRYTGWGG